MANPGVGSGRSGFVSRGEFMFALFNFWRSRLTALLGADDILKYRRGCAEISTIGGGQFIEQILNPLNVLSLSLKTR